MKKLIIMFALLIVAVPHLTNAATKNNGQVKSFKAGGVPVLIPPPSSVFVEVGDEKRHLMEVFVPQNNRLISGFVLTADLPKLGKGGDDAAFTQYAMVEVPRHGENMDFGPNDFKEVVGSAKESFGDIIASSAKDAEEEFNRRMKSLDLANVQVNIGKPLMLGCLFSKPNAYGFGMITKYSGGGTAMKMVIGAAVLRVKKRLLFVYLYSEFKNDDMIKWIRKTTEEWSDAILKVNK